MGKAIPTVEGWHSQHMVFSMDFSAWNCFEDSEKAEARNELKAFKQLPSFIRRFSKMGT